MIALLLLFSSFISADADSSDYENIYEHAYLKGAETLWEKGNYKDALFLYQKARSLFIEEQNHAGVCASNIRMGNILSYNSEYDSASIYLIEAIHLARNYLDCDSLIISDAYHYLGKLHDYQYKPDSAIYYLEKALDIRKSIKNSKETDIALSFCVLGDVHRYSYLDYHAAEKYYQQALRIYERTDSTMLAITYYRLGTNARLKGNTEAALSFVNEALRLYKKNAPEDYFHLSICSNEKANCYYQQLDYERAVWNYRKAIQYIFNSPPDIKGYLPHYYINFGAVWIDKQNIDSAIYYTNLGIKAIKNTTEIDSVSLAIAYQQLGNAYLDYLPDSAIYFYNQGFTITQRSYGENHAQLIDFYIGIGKSYEKFSDFESAIGHYQKALTISGYSWSKAEFTKLTSFEPYIIKALDRLASCKHQLYKKTRNSVFLTEALNSFVNLDKIIQRHRNDFFHDKTQLLVSEEVKEYYEHAIACAYDLHLKNPSDTTAATLFHFMESNKAWLLLEAINQAEVYSSVGLPDSIYKKEQSIQSQIAYYQSELPYYEANEPEKLPQIRSKIFTLERQMRQLLDTISANHTNYFEAKYVSSSYSLKDLSLFLSEKNSSFIEYFLGDSAIYMLFLDGNMEMPIIHKEPITSTMTESIQTFLNCLTTTPTTKQRGTDYNDFLTSAHTLYNILLSPVIQKTDSKFDKITIIPDGLLSYIPFEAILTSTKHQMNINYASLDYLIKQYAISYHYSARILLESSKQSRDKSYPEKILAFGYEGVPSSDKQLSKPHILWTGKEIDYIEKIFPILKFTGDKATEENFKKNIPQAGIIHLAMHGNTDLQNPMKAGITFQKEKLGREDGFLNFYEIMNLPLKSRMAVLSACETATGKEFKGEGVYHIARGFTYAGCPTLVASLWQIDDRSTATIVNSFYTEIKAGENIDESIAKSKRAYLQQADEYTAHPRYWSGMILIGETQPIFSLFSYTDYPRLIMVIVILIASAWIFRAVYLLLNHTQLK